MTCKRSGLLIHTCCWQADDSSLPQLTPAEVARYDTFWGRFKSRDNLQSSFPEPLRVPSPSLSATDVTQPAQLASQFPVEVDSQEPVVPTPTSSPGRSNDRFASAVTCELGSAGGQACHQPSGSSDNSGLTTAVPKPACSFTCTSMPCQATKCRQAG